jgi:hypothetical protein
MPVMPDAAILAAGSHDQAHTTARAYALRRGESGRREVSDKLRHALAESECDQPNTGNGDCEKETVGNEFITCPHDRTPLFDQNIDHYAEPSIHRAARTHLL